MRFAKYFIFSLLLFVSSNLFSQHITIKGKVLDAKTMQEVPFTYIVNKSTNNGVNTDVSGDFSINTKNSDTILVSCMGYVPQKIIVKDSLNINMYYTVIKLSTKTYQLKTVEIIPQRTYRQLQKDIKSIEYAELDKLKNMNTFDNYVGSPITYLYMKYNRQEKSKRLVEELVNNEKRLEIMKELFSSYLFKNIIELNEKELEQFIRYCNLKDDFVLGATEYELVSYVKAKYERFIKMQ